VTRWGLVLLLTFLALGLRSSLDTRRALKYGVWAVALVIVFVSARNHAL
jgi:hypothetical protein